MNLLNECMTQKLSRFEYLKIYILSVIISCFVFLCNSLKKIRQLVLSVLKGNEKEGHSYIGSQFREESSWTWALDQRVK